MMHGCLQESVVIGRGNVSFSVDFEYENASKFYGACHQIGHLTANCRRLNPNEGQNKENEKLDKKNVQSGALGKSKLVSKSQNKVAQGVADSILKNNEDFLGR